MSRELVCATYRGLLRCAKRLEFQALRHGSTVHLLPENELEVLAERYPRFSASLKAGAAGDRRADLRSLIAETFRTVHVHQDGALDDALDTLGMVNRRLTRIERFAAEPRSSHLSQGVRVMVESQIVPADSLPPGFIKHFAFRYKVTIRNESNPDPVRVVDRRWVVEDAEGNVKETGGPSPMPQIEQGTEYSYMSAIKINALKGTMHGTLTFMSGAQVFDVEVPPFALVPFAEPGPWGPESPRSDTTDD
mmetsp:Transcript_4032/g.14100  ORF Transcript_4032/g.14100 Transcript_4032/m.14100 type:complete len:249 (-) Transcript_4032:252-998(-)